MRNLMHQFTISRHRKMSTTGLFNIRQGSSESLRNYLSHFNKATIKVFHSNQEMFVGEFQNKLNAGHFNESFAQLLAFSLAKVVARVECYIKGAESNTEKKPCYTKDRVTHAEISHPLKKNKYTLPTKDKSLL